MGCKLVACVMLWVTQCTWCGGTIYYNLCFVRIDTVWSGPLSPPPCTVQENAFHMHAPAIPLVRTAITMQPCVTRIKKNVSLVMHDLVGARICIAVCMHANSVYRHTKSLSLYGTSIVMRILSD